MPARLHRLWYYVSFGICLQQLQHYYTLHYYYITYFCGFVEALFIVFVKGKIGKDLGLWSLETTETRKNWNQDLSLTFINTLLLAKPNHTWNSPVSSLYTHPYPPIHVKNLQQFRFPIKTHLGKHISHRQTSFLRDRVEEKMLRRSAHSTLI